MSDIEVWHTTLDRPADETHALYDLLDEPERARAARFQRPSDRDRFVVARGTLRMLLGDYTSVAPASVPICLAARGKPSLDRASNTNGIHFNISHCGPLGIFAFWDRDIGIDVQKREENGDIARLVLHFFSPDERAEFDQLPASESIEFFFRVWVRKEAYLKATGEGFSVDPATIDVGGRQPCRVVRYDSPGRLDTDIDYVVRDVDDLAGYASAVSFSATPREPVIRLRQWTQPAAASGAGRQSALSR